MIKFWLPFFLILFSRTANGQWLENMSFGTDSTLEVVSWNIEWFPKQGETTLDYFEIIVRELDADIYALQEIDSYTQFVSLVDDMPGWDGIAFHDGYLSLAFLYQEKAIKVNQIYQILENKSRELPRAPLVMDVDYYGNNYIIINNHFKCCGDGILDTSDSWDEEKRRLDASMLIDSYIKEHFPEKRVIILGDLNDILTDESANNVFVPFLDNPEEYIFADMPIAEGHSEDWSYPTWPSHLDHIIISNELESDFLNEASVCEIIKPDEYLSDGWWAYDQYISDHRPVALRLNAGQFVAVVNQRFAPNNPIEIRTDGVNQMEIVFKENIQPINLKIYTIGGELIKSIEITNLQKMRFNTDDFVTGVYIFRLQTFSNDVFTQKLIITK